MPQGLRRLLIAVSLVWLVGFFLIEQDDIGFGWTAAWSTPRTTCTDVYREGDSRLSACEFAAPGNWAADMERKAQGEKVSFDYYQALEGSAAKRAWFLWLGIPLILFGLLRLGLWVREGFIAKPQT